MTDKIVITPEVRLGRLEREFRRMIIQAQKASGETESSFVKANQGANLAERGTKRLGFAVGNLSAQLNDIGVSLAGGQSPFQVMLQQGTQVNQIFQQTGASAGTFFTLLREAAVSMINPFSLATFAIIGLGGAALQYLSSTSEEVNATDEALKAHAENIKSLKEAYGEALEGVEAYARESDAVLRQGAEANVAWLTERLSAEIRAAMESFGSVIDVSSFGGARAFRGTEVFTQLNAAIDALAESARNGDPDVRAFRESITELEGIDPSNQAIQELIDGFLGLTDNASNVQGALEVARAAIEQIGGVAAGQVADVNALTSALNRLANIALPALSEADEISRNMRAGLSAANGNEEARRRVLAQTAAARQRLANQSLPGGGEIPTPEERPLIEFEPLPKARGGGRTRTPKATPEEQFENTVEAARQRVAAMQAETAALSQLNPLQNDYGRTLTFVQTQQQLLADAKRRDVELTPAQIAAIDEVAASMADASVVAKRLAESQQEIRQTAEEMQNFQKATMKGFISDLMNGVSAAEALENALGKVADKLIDIALNNVFDAMGGSSGGGGGGNIIGNLIGSLFGKKDPWAGARGFSMGTANTGGSRGQVMGAVHGQEAVIPLPQNGKVPVQISTSGNGLGQARVQVEVVEGELFTARVRSESQGVSLQVVNQYDKNKTTLRRNGEKF